MSKSKKNSQIQTVYQIFKKQYQLQPQKVAIIEEDYNINSKQITYAQLYQAVDFVAEKIEKFYNIYNSCIGIYGERSIATIIYILAILKSGNCFVPVNKDYSKDYICNVIQDADIQLILSTDHSFKVLNIFDKDKIMEADDIKIGEISEESGTELAKDKSNSENPFLILFTSGTSGRPKGVIHNQRQILNFCNHMWEVYQLRKDDCICHRTRMEYMPALWEIFGGILYGMTTVILPDCISLDPSKNISAIIKEKITIVQGIPSYIQRMFDTANNIDQVETVRLWITVGEPASKYLLDKICSLFPKANFVVEYGATELGGVLHYTKADYIDNNYEIPWYKPIQKVEAYIVSDEGEICKEGESGILCFKGLCVAISYLKVCQQSENTALSCNLDGDNRSYRTGDLAVSLPNGRVKILGRNDRQVKICGVRIELQAIESVITEIKGIKESAVMIKTMSNDLKHIIAFVIINEESDLTIDKIKRIIADKLPTFYMPNRIIQLTEMPHLYNGKLNKKQLEEMLKNQYEAIEESQYNKREVVGNLATIASFVLESKVEYLKPEYSFKENGFNSLTILDYLNYINKEYGLTIELNDIFDHPTMNDLANFISSKSIYIQGKNEDQLEKGSTSNNRQVAIIGISGKFPLAEDIDVFWSNLLKGVNSISEVPHSRWNMEEYMTSDFSVRGKSVSKWGGFLDCVEDFDYNFFHLSPKEAQLMDPQLRIVLEESWKALEDSGNVEKIAQDTTGVFIGASKGDYFDLLQSLNLDYEPFATTGCDSAMIASRISYYLNLKGPSLTIDTACSSSLVAVHLAASNIINGSCTMAIAGGVHIMTTPRIFLKSSAMNILASDGICSAFDDGAHGIAPGEGVGIVVLKELNKAIEDNDNIYAVIQGSAMNQNGKTNSISAPSPAAQKELFQSVYYNNHINPEEISLVEAHGTGTRLGDPAELSSLEKVFRCFTKKKNFCAIGSVKTNVGHSITCAGVTGLIKAVLSVKNGLIPPILNYEKPNKLFDIEESPFYINTTCVPYTNNKRVAAVSSFGLNGSNCHMVVEAYENPVKENNIEESYYIFPYSAKSKASLTRYIKKFISWLFLQGDRYSLRDIAYTLQKGRTPFEYRAAFVAGNIQELYHNLNQYLDENEKTEVSRECYDDATISRITTGLFNKKKIIEDLVIFKNLFCYGYHLDWDLFYQSKMGRIISMPTYAFEPYRCWLDDFSSKHLEKDGIIIEKIDENYFHIQFKPVLEQICEHKIFGYKIFPASLLLSSLIQLMKQKEGHVIYSFESVSFTKMFLITDIDCCISIRLKPKENGYKYSIFDIKNVSESICEGIIVPQLIEPMKVINITELQNQMNGTLHRDEVYNYYKKRNIQYGLKYQFVDQIITSDKQLLASFQKSEAWQRAYSDILSRGMLLDAAMHAIAGIECLTECQSTFVPVLVKCMKYYNIELEPYYSHIEIGAECNDSCVCADITILGKFGEVLAEIKDILLRSIRKENIVNSQITEMEYSTNAWIKKELQRKDVAVENVLIFYSKGQDEISQFSDYIKGELAYVKKADGYLHHRENNYFEYGNDKEDINRLFKDLDELKVVFTKILFIDTLTETNTDIKYEIESRISPIYHIVKNLLIRLTDKKITFLLYYIQEESYLIYHAMTSFFRTVHEENSLFGFKTVGLPRASLTVNKNLIIDEMQEVSTNEAVLYEQEERKVQIIEEISKSHVEQYNFHGVYLITGGLGSLGYLVAKYIAEKSDSSLAIIGNTEYEGDDIKSKRMQTLLHTGRQVLYLRADAGCEKELSDAIIKVRQKFGRITGIIHCAGVINDKLVLNKTEEEFFKTINAKACGLSYLEKLTQQDDPELFVMFSSVSSVYGKAGQSDYAYANGYLDAFSYLREKKRSAGIIAGKTVAINWPLWKNGSMQLSTEGMAKYLQQGNQPLEDEEGTYGFHVAASLPFNQIIISKKDKRKRIMKVQTVFNQTESVMQPEENTYTEYEILNICIKVLSEQLNIKSDQMTTQTTFEELGINSLVMFDLLNQLEKYFGNLPKTLFFTYKIVGELVEYLTSLQGTKQKQPDISKDFNTQEKYSVSLNNLKNIGKEDGVAIVGVAGRYPQANTLDEFWDNLLIGKDCITEIPQNRWDIKKYFDPDKSKPGKHYSKWGGFLSDIDKFDNLFFQISSKEAELMDPQERLFLEVAWETMENSGYTRKMFSGKKVGVFVGVMWNQYQLYGMEDSIVEKPKSISASIANRVSYSMNFKGISIAVDTMCSSSLTALKLANDAIKNREIDYAIVGGVNLMTHPNKYHILCQEKFASSDGRCRSFGEGGDGYVPGEGVGAVLLTSLNQAESDNAYIYALIKACAVNHGGRSNGYTVPSPVAQSEVIEAAINASGVEPICINYIEAHGTGTSLGDPIEIEGIKTAFEKVTSKKEFCSIASVKSNIGHLEAAAGIVSITKVLYQLKYGLLVPSIHADKLNPYIDFKNSPVYVQTDLQPWKAPINQQGEEALRCAGISSFGAGGANAFVILEEYKQKKEFEQPKEPQLILLSAQTHEQLKEYAQKLVNHISNQQKKPKKKLDTLKNIAYTLQTGREAFAVRIAFVVHNDSELIRFLQAYVDDKPAEGLINTVAVGGMSTSAINKDFTADKVDMRSLFDKKELRILGDYWVNGWDIHWKQFYAEGTKLSMVALPTYPFRRDAYWIKTQSNCSKLHPFIDENASTTDEICFKKIFKKTDTLIKSHQIAGTSVIPGVILLEMACAAAQIYFKKKVHFIEDVCWFLPIEMNQDERSIKVLLYPQGDKIHYSVIDESGQTFSKGTLGFDRNIVDGQEKEILYPMEKLEKRISQEACYSYFKNRSLNYEDPYITIQEIHCYKNTVIAKLSNRMHLDNQYVYHLHPVLFDGALQSIIGFECLNDTTRLPFSVDRIDVFSETGTPCTIVAKKQQDKYDLWIFDHQQNLIMKVVGFLLREISMDLESRNNQLIIIKEECKKIELNVTINLSGEVILIFDKNNEIPQDTIASFCTDCIVFKVLDGPSFSKEGNTYNINYSNQDDYNKLMKDLNMNSMVATSIVYHWSNGLDEEEYSLGNCVKDWSKQLLYFTKCMEQLYHDSYIKTAFTFSGYHTSTISACTAAFLRCKYVENSRHTFKCINFQKVMLDWNAIFMELSNHFVSIMEITYDLEGRKIHTIHEGNESKEIVCEPYEEGNVYIITGGSGGLGKIFAQYFVSRSRSMVILLGRRTAEDIVLPECKNGSCVEYIQMDVTNYEDVQKMYDFVIKKYHKIDGVIHCAGINKDALIRNKDFEEMELVLKPKVDGLINLNKVLEKEQLKFFISFSSLAAVAGNKGQGDYAFANRFMDCYTKECNSILKSKGKKECYYSVNWSIWQNGVMSVDAESLRNLKKYFGIVPLNVNDGISLFEACIAGKNSCVIATKGNLTQIENWMRKEREYNPTNAENTVEKVNPTVTESVYEKDELLEIIKQMVGDITKIPLQRIDEYKEFKEYGIDSIMLTELNNELQKRIDSNIKNAFIENNTIYSVYESIINSQKQLMKIDNVPVLQKSSSRIYLPMEKNNRNESCKIAIVGMGCKFPMADNLDYFWKNLKSGQNCITQLPKERVTNCNIEEFTLLEDKVGGFISDINTFDPLFFNIAPSEAIKIAPHVKIALQVTWQALEDAGYSKHYLSQLEGQGKRVGIFIGCMDYSNLWTKQEHNDGTRPFEQGNWSIANRISYFLGITGPSMVIDTACSSSITAIHLASESIKKGECDIAIVGGVNLNLNSQKYLSLIKEKLLTSHKYSPSLCDGDGYVPGEGVGIVILRNSLGAEANNDKLYCYITGSQICHSGKTKAYKVPSSNEIYQLMNELMIHTQAEEIDFFESASSGLGVGDLAELEAIGQILNNPMITKPCPVGSVKSYIGHLEAASGISQLIKIALQLKHKLLVPSVNNKVFEKTRNLDEYNLTLTKEVVGWKSNRKWEDAPLRVIINSIGAGGANGALLVEEFKEKRPEGKDHCIDKIILLSANTEETLIQYAFNLQEFLLENNEITLDQLAYTLAMRESFSWRLAIIAQTKEEYLSILKHYLNSSECFENAWMGNCIYDNEYEMIPKEFTPNDIAKQWCSGKNYHWRERYDGALPDVRIPHYPFEKFSNDRMKNPNDTNSGETVIDKELGDVIRKLIISLVSEILMIATEQINLNVSFDSYGMTSISASELLDSLSERLSESISYTTLYNNFSVEQLAQAIYEQGITYISMETEEYIREEMAVSEKDDFGYFLENMLLTGIKEKKFTIEQGIKIREIVTMFTG